MNNRRSQLQRLRSRSFTIDEDFAPRNNCNDCAELNKLCYKHVVVKYNYIKYLVDDLSSAIANQGPSPEKHRRIMRRHRRQWPTIWRKIDRLVEWRGRH